MINAEGLLVVLYSALAGIAVLVFLAMGVANLFILHGVVIDGSLAGFAVICLFIPLKLITLLPAGPFSRLLTVFFVAAGVLVMFTHFDQFFPLETDVKVIAHRAGGNEGRENTLSGLEAAWTAGAYGSEIDIQRTKDGYYVLNHDGTFKRVAGDSRKPEEMTLREVKKLSVDGEPVPTFEEMLIASRGRMVLFTELKGKTAELNCDYIGFEEESATTDAIDNIHKEGKKVLVWTANEKGSQKHFLCTEADGIITDNVSQAIGLATELEQRSDLDRMVDKIRTVF